VQGVGFRYFAEAAAAREGLHGWVRNLPDGRVEAVLEGPPEEVHRLVDWAHHGPDAAAVTDVAVREERPEGLGPFVIR
jgi:acylphosphatase